MAGLSDLLGRGGAVEQLLLWGVVNQVVQALGSPAFIALTQDVSAAHPELVLTPAVLADAVARHLISEATAAAEARASGVNPSRFAILRELATVRISPADLAEAVLRSYMTEAAAQAEAAPQGIDPGRLKILTDLAGDAPGPQDLAVALRRGIIAAHGRGETSTSYEQGIAETRLHDKWGPVLQRLSVAVLPPADAASAVVRNFRSYADAEKAAAESGVTPADFATLTHLAGDAPAPGQLAEALRRHVIPDAGKGPAVVSFEQGIAEGRLADKWAPVIKALAQLWPTPAEALTALLKGQVTHDEALRLYEQFGGDPQFFDLLFHTEGESPTPLELIAMANRGFIPWTGTGPDVTSYEQGFKEGRWRNKWAPAFQRFARYIPPESTVVTLLAHGAIGEREAAAELAKQGMAQELIAAYLDEAHTTALSDYRGLSVAATLDAYRAQIISTADAAVILEALHVTPRAVHLLLAYEDIRRAFTAVTTALSRVRTLFAARKITAATARSALGALQVPAASVEGIMAAWELENSVSVRVLTEAQIVDAWELKILTEAEALTELGNLGFTPFDAWVLLSIKAKAPLTGRPPQGPAPPQAQVIAGTT